jgi:hypothetical protein
MKTFKDLKFEKHQLASGEILIYQDAKQATMNFENRYGVSVVFGNCFYSNGIDTYEVAILFEDSLCYTTHITDDVIGYQTKTEVSKIMKQVQEL